MATISKRLWQRPEKLFQWMPFLEKILIGRSDSVNTALAGGTWHFALTSDLEEACVHLAQDIQDH